MHPSRAVAIAAFTFAVFASPATAQAPTQAPPRLHWQRTPTGDDVERVFPKDAVHKGISGGAMIGCNVAPDGALTQCKAFADLPAGMGFGEAGVLLSAYFRLSADSIATLPVPGRIAIPMAFGAPGRPTPRLSFQLSDSALLLTNYDGARDAGTGTNVDCLAAPPPRRCVMHFITWAAKPNVMVNLAATLRVGKTSGSDLVLCWVGAGGKLTGCRGSGSAAGALMTDEAAGFTAPPRADDGSPVGEGPIMITLNWAALSAAAQALKPDEAVAQPAGAGL